MKTLGKHWLIELRGCRAKLLEREDTASAILQQAALEAKATIVSSSFHQFEPFGVSGVIIIQESHFTIHTWPEYQYCAIDFFTCGDTIDAQAAIDYLRLAFEAKEVEVQYFDRGILPNATSDSAR